jgi:hypothetical protein
MPSKKGMDAWMTDIKDDRKKTGYYRVAFYSPRNDHAQKTRFYCCVRNITPRRSHVTPSQYCWSVTSCACVEVCLPSRNPETDYVTPLFHCWHVYYLETADSVAQPVANRPHCSLLKAVRPE